MIGNHKDQSRANTQITCWKDRDKGREDSRSKARVFQVALPLVLIVISLAASGCIKTSGESGTFRESKVITATITPPVEFITVTEPTVAPEESDTTPSPTETGSASGVIKLPQPLPNVFYTEHEFVYHISGDEVKRKAITRHPSDGYNLFFLRLSEDGQKVFYPDNIDVKKTDFYADLYCFVLDDDNPQRIKIDSGVNEFTCNQDGSKVFYLKDQGLYVSDLTQSRLIAENTVECYIDQKGEVFVYRTSDGHLFIGEGNKPAAEIDSKTFLRYASRDLNTILYFKENDLYLLKDRKNIQKLASGVRPLNESLILPSGGTSFYFLQYYPLKVADYVNDDLANSDALLKEPDPSDYPDQDSYEKAREQYEGKRKRDEIRQRMNSTETTRWVNALYFYSDGQMTKITDYCTHVWRYDDSAQGFDGNRPLLAYLQILPDKIQLSDVSDYSDIEAHLENMAPEKAQQYLCNGTEKSRKFYDGGIERLIYDPQRNRVFFVLNFNRQTQRGDLYEASLEGETENRKIAEKVLISDPLTPYAGEQLVYFKYGENLQQNYDLYVDHQKIDSFVVPWVYPIGDSNVFLYQNYMYGDDWGTEILKLYKDGKVTEIADRVETFQILNENSIVYTVSERYRRRLYLFDGSDTPILLAEYAAGSPVAPKIVIPSTDDYHCLKRSTFSN